jgi:hypothetical protein
LDQPVRRRELVELGAARYHRVIVVVAEVLCQFMRVRFTQVLLDDAKSSCRFATVHERRGGSVAPVSFADSDLRGVASSLGGGV